MMQFESPLMAFEHWEKKTPEREFLRQYHNGQLEVLNYREAGEQARRMASALLGLNLPEGSNIALLSKNCSHWILADLAIMMCGHVSVPIYPTLHDESIRPILQHSGCRVAFLGKLDDFPSQEKAFKDLVLISVEKYGIRGTHTWESMLEGHEPLREAVHRPKDALISILYTSGTTGMPKGVMHSVGNFVRAAHNLFQNLWLEPEPRFFSYLPLSHIAERIGLEIGCLIQGGSLTFSESVSTFASDLEQTQPDLFFAVPRIWSKFQEKILEGLPQKKLDLVLQIPILNAFFKKKLRFKLGLSRASYIVSGAAPISVSLLEWYKKLGIEILQAYGMTEDCAISHCNLPGQNRMGSVGKPTYGATAKLSATGEICVKNDCLMLGYYKLPEVSADSFDEHGYLRTGDVGEYDHEGYLFITGRAKDQFKTDKGKYISPSPIELQVSKNQDVEQVCIVGMGIPQPIMLVIPSAEGRRKSRAELAESLLQTILEINPGLEKHEKIEKAVVMKEDWTIENGLMTPTLKVKRSQVEKIHMPMYRAWFDSKERVIYE